MPFKSVWVATDFITEARAPWVHALRVCSGSSTSLIMLHVDTPDLRGWQPMVTAQVLLKRWGVIQEGQNISHLDFMMRLLELPKGPPAKVIAEEVAEGRPLWTPPAAR